MTKTVLLSGYYGFNNLGDEAVLGGLLAGLRMLPEVTPIVLSADPAATTAQHGVAAIPRGNLVAIRQALRGADLFISGGGSLLQDVTSVRSPYYYLGLLWLAQRAGVPTMLLAQGVGPLRHPVTRLITRAILNRSQAITVRDAASASFLRRLGVTRSPVEVTADTSFLLEPDHSARLVDWWKAHMPAGRPVIGVALRRWRAGQAADRYTAIADALAAFAADSGALLLFLPMQFERDLPVVEEVAGWTPAESRVLNLSLSPREMLAVVGQCDFILGMRLHSLIFAVQRDVPAFGLAYDPKVLDFSLAAGLPAPLPWQEITADFLAAALEHHWDQRDLLASTLADNAAHLTLQAKRNIGRVSEVLASTD